MHSAWEKIKSFYCINLDTNPGRWDLSKEQFDKVGIESERIVVTESPENRYLSFNKSHYDLVLRGLNTGDNFAIFEDDIKFDKIWKHIEEAMNELPKDWDMLYLGCNFMGDWTMPYKYSQHLSWLPNAWQTHAIVYSNAGAKWVAENFDPNTFPVYDEWLRVNSMPTRKVFLLTPMICYQRPGFSDIWKNDVDYTGVHVDGNKWLKFSL